MYRYSIKQAVFITKLSWFSGRGEVFHQVNVIKKARQ